MALSPQPTFATAATAALGPRLASQSWHNIAAALAREPAPVETAMQAAMRRALEQGGRA
jgi:hypothetical protein